MKGQLYNAVIKNKSCHVMLTKHSFSFDLSQVKREQEVLIDS